MNIIQKLVTSLVPKRWAAAIEAESKEWKLICPKCAHERSVWDAGGIRWKARSVGKRILQRCESCGETGMARVERKTGAPKEP